MCVSASKTDSKPGEKKQPSTLRTSAGTVLTRLSQPLIISDPFRMSTFFEKQLTELISHPGILSKRLATTEHWLEKLQHFLDSSGVFIAALCR